VERAAVSSVFNFSTCTMSITVPDVTTLAEFGLQEAARGTWEITLDEGSCIWGRVVVRSLKDATIFQRTDHKSPPMGCQLSFRRRDKLDVKVTGTEMVQDTIVVLRWGVGSKTWAATLEKFDKDEITWRSTNGQHNVWKRISREVSSSGSEKDETNADEVDKDARVVELEKAAEKAAEGRFSARQELMKAQLKHSEELKELRAQLALSEELAEARADVADEIADENLALRKELDSQLRTAEVQIESNGIPEETCTPQGKALSQDGTPLGKETSIRSRGKSPLTLKQKQQEQNTSKCSVGQEPAEKKRRVGTKFSYDDGTDIWY